MSDGGKGSGRRSGKMPDDAWERTFGKKPTYESCCDEYCSTHGCNQGRDCPVRIARIEEAKKAINDDSEWPVFELITLLASIAVAMLSVWIIAEAIRVAFG